MQPIHVEQHSRRGRALSYTVSQGPYILLITTSKRIALDYRARLLTVEQSQEGLI